MKNNTLLFLSLIFLLYMSSPAGAVEEINQEHIKTLEVDAQEDLYFSSMEIRNIDSNSNVNLTLNKYGEIYLLNVSAQKNYYTQWVFDVTVTNPNGSVETKHLTNIAPLAGSYNLHIQSYWWQYNTSLAQVLDLNLYTSLLPVTAQTVYVGSLVNSGAIDQANIDYTTIPFSHIGFTSSSYVDCTIYAVNKEELAKQQNKSLTASVTEATSDLFIWTWASLLEFVAKIPLVGGHLSAVLVLTTMTLSSIIFYTRLLFIDYSETTFLTIEFFILSYSFTKRGSFWSKIKRVVDSHVKLIELTLNTAQAAVNLFSSIVRVVADVIQSLKPV